jgi:mycothiol synthase
VRVELRAPTLDDVEELAELANRETQELFGEREESADSVRLWLTDPDLDPATDARLALLDGRVVGYADINDRPEPKYWADLRVPLSEGDEVREALVDWLERRFTQRAAGNEGALLRFFAWSLDEPVKRLLEHRGHRLIRHSYRMRIDFAGELPEPEWPEGITLRTPTDADAQVVYETHQESFEDSWEHHRDPFEEWEHWLRGSDAFDPTLWFLAEDRGEPAGVALCKPHDAEEGFGWVSVLGVRRPWRRRGLGRALLLHAFHEFRRRGFSGVGLGVDASSLTGAVRLYENAGMRVARRSDIYEKTI